MTKLNIKTTTFNTPLGPMRAEGDDKTLYVLEFVDQLGEKEKPPEGAVLSIQEELKRYFAGDLREFKTSLAYLGTSFQRSVWGALLAIPLGETRAYADIAKAIGKPKAFRAVARACGANLLPIIIPCHRVIQTNSKLGGYASGIQRKQWLLQHEKDLL